jgi:hypothetical protein
MAAIGMPPPTPKSEVCSEEVMDVISWAECADTVGEGFHETLRLARSLWSSSIMRSKLCLLRQFASPLMHQLASQPLHAKTCGQLSDGWMVKSMTLQGAVVK